MPPSSPSDYIEMLTADEDGNAVEGPKYPRDLGTVVYQDPEDFSGTRRLAYPHKFFKRDEHGQPVPGTIVRFLVPDYLCAGAAPSRRALELVEQRMGWGRPNA